MILNRVLSTEESPEVLVQVQRLLTANRFHARSIVQSHDTIEQWHIEVDHSAQQWFAVNDLGQVHEFRDGVTFHHGEPVTRPTDVSSELVGPLLAAFPDRLQWWEGRGHGFRPVLIEQVGNQSLLLTFEHGADQSMRATLVVDTKLGLVTRVMHFDSPYIMLLDVELDRRIERLTPDSFPALEVVYPQY